MNSLHDALLEDAQYMEDAASRLAARRDIWQDRIVYRLAVAVGHIIQWIMRRET